MIKKSFTIITLTLFALLLSALPGSVRSSHSDELRGKELLEDKNCTRCHTIGRGRFVGPDLYGIGSRYDKEDIISWASDPGVIYQKLGKTPVNEGYPPMPKLSVSALEAEKIAGFLLNNQIKKTGRVGGTVAGKVKSGTTGGTIEGADVYLRSFMGDKKVDEKLFISDENGQFSFRDLRWDRSYSLRINSDGVEYETAKMVFPLDEEVIDIDLPVFDVSSDDSDIVINVNHHVIELENKAISVVEIYEFENRGNAIFIGTKDPEDDFNKAIRLNVPEEAESINFVKGISTGSAVREGNVIYDTAGFPPGIKRVVVAYKLPLGFGRSKLKKVFFYDAASAFVIATEQSNVEAEGLGEMKTFSISDQSYRQWTGSDIKRGKSIEISYYSMQMELNKIELYPAFIFALLLACALLFRMKKSGGRPA